MEARPDSESCYDRQISCSGVVAVHGEDLLVPPTCKLPFQRVMHSRPSSWLGVAPVFQAGVAKGLLVGGEGGGAPSRAVEREYSRRIMPSAAGFGDSRLLVRGLAGAKGRLRDHYAAGVRVLLESR